MMINKTSFSNAARQSVSICLRKLNIFTVFLAFFPGAFLPFIKNKSFDFSHHRVITVSLQRKLDEKQRENWVSRLNKFSNLSSNYNSVVFILNLINLHNLVLIYSLIGIGNNRYKPFGFLLCTLNEAYVDCRNTCYLYDAIFLITSIT